MAVLSEKITSRPVREPIDAADIETGAETPVPHWSEVSARAPRVPRDAGFAALLGPIDEAEFVTRYFGREVLYSPAQPGRTAHRDILTLDGLLEAIAQHRVPSDHLRFLSGHEDKELDEYDAESFARSVRGRSQSSFARIRDYLARGRGSMVAYALDLFLPSVHRFMAAAGEVTGSRIGANTYYTPAQARVFSPHWDTHDVLIVQLHGTKHWRVYETVLEHPLPGREYMESTPYEGFADDLPFQELTLREGDMLYLPAGVPHAARTEDEDSLHLTGALMPVRWHEVLQDVAEDALREAEKELETRAPCPAWFLGADAADVEAEREAMIERFAARMRATPLSASIARLHAAQPVGFPQAHLRPPTVDLNTPLSRPRSLSFLLEGDDEASVQLCHVDRRLFFPAEVAPALRWVLDHVELRPADLPGLDDEDRVHLARRLLEEGILQDNVNPTPLQ